jgi:hypothetical protein
MMRWMLRGKRVRGGESSDDGTRAVRPLDDLTSSLEDRGVSVEYAGALAARIEPRARKLSGAAREALVEGAAISWATHADAQAGVDQNMKEIKEVERLMGAFSGELSKLDEVLEVLAAYVKRMRTSNPDRETRTLH